MALEFEGDAISLSGLTGSKLKSEIIGEYYPFWWNITSVEKETIINGRLLLSNWTQLLEKSILKKPGKLSSAQRAMHLN